MKDVKYIWIDRVKLEIKKTKSSFSHHVGKVMQHLF